MGREASSSTINQKLSAIKKMAAIGEDNSIIEAKTANSIRTIKGLPKQEVKTGNSLTIEEARDRAILTALIGCGLRSPIIY